MGAAGSRPDAIPQSAAALDKAARQDWGRLVASLIKTLGDFQLAEDCLQDAVESALVHWTRSGVPRSPAAWLLQTARRKAIDRIRRDANFRGKQDEYAYLLELDAEAAMEPENLQIPDERLSLIFTCCHPALDRKSQVALTLRTLGGLTTPEIARAFLDAEPAMAQRLVRAKRKIAAAAIPYRVPGPGELPERAGAVLDVIYLVFNEGYSASAGDDLVRASLCEEAIRLARIVTRMVPPLPEASGLLALMLLNAARLPARTAPGGAMIALDRQDRTLWNKERIAEGRALVSAALGPDTATPFLIQAAISALHCEADSHEATDWPQIAALYDVLGGLMPTAVVRLNRAVALSYAQSPQSALAAMAPLAAELSAYQPFHASRADVLRRCGRIEEARAAYAEAVRLSANGSEKAFLAARLRELAH